MPQAGSCKLCEHAQIESINTALAAGQAVKAIARQFSVSASTLTRHRATCLPQSLPSPETERAAPPPLRPGVTPELLDRIILANQSVQNTSGSALTVAIRQFAQTITDAITDNGAPQP